MERIMGGRPRQESGEDAAAPVIYFPQEAMPDIVEAHLRADRNLSPETAKALSELFASPTRSSACPAARNRAKERTARSSGFAVSILHAFKELSRAVKLKSRRGSICYGGLLRIAGDAWRVKGIMPLVEEQHPPTYKGRQYELRAQGLRAFAGLRRDDEPLDPFDLARYAKIYVVGFDEIAGLSHETREHLLGAGSDLWSGGTCAQRLPNGWRLVILNPEARAGAQQRDVDGRSLPRLSRTQSEPALNRRDEQSGEHGRARLQRR
jgi:hypothetical protein